MEKADNSPPNSKGGKKKSHPFWKVFWLTFLVASLGYAWYSFYAPPNDVEWAVDMASAQEIADGSDKNMMLFFTGVWCSPCRIMKREIFADDEVMKKINSQIIPVMIDIDDPTAKEIVERYNVKGTPITIFTDARGEVLDYAVGRIGKAKFLEMLGSLSAAGS
jgi:protein disulfide-isomerase